VLEDPDDPDLQRQSGDQTVVNMDDDGQQLRHQNPAQLSLGHLVDPQQLTEVRQRQ
jgi:hypothetical protein